MITGTMQLGKNGVTQGFIETLKNYFKTHEVVRVSILKSAGHSKEKAREYSERILIGLGEYYTTRIIGFVIVVKKWRKPRR